MAQYIQVFKTSPDYDPRRLNVPSLFILAARSDWSEADLKFIRALKYAPAAAVFRMNITAYPRSADGYIGLAESLLKMGDTEGAITNFAEALRLDPENKRACEGMEKAKKRLPS